MRTFWTVVCAGLVACGAKATSEGGVADVSVAADTTVVTTVDGAAGGDIGAGLTCGDNWAQGYCIKFTFHGQKYEGRSFTLQRDLTGTSSTVVFGNTHLQPPAASLAIDDTWQLGPYKDLLHLSLVLGNLIEAPGFPAFVPKAGDYPFGCTPPYLDITYGSVRYRSTCPGLQGSIVITQWSGTPGQQLTGHFSGHLQQFLGAEVDCTKPAEVDGACKSAINTVDIEGTFGVTLPELNAAVAP